MNPRVNDAALVLRLTLALIVLYHGSQTLFGGSGGTHLTAAGALFDAMPGIPRMMDGPLSIFKYYCGVSILAGFLTRLSAAGIGVIAVAAMAMPTFTGATGPAYTMPVAILGLCLALLLTGAGSFSIDRILRKRYGNEGLAGRLMG